MAVCRSFCKRQDRLIVAFFALYCVFVLMYYIIVFAVNPGSVISRQANAPVAPFAPFAPVAPNISAPALPGAPTNTTPADTPTMGINGGITIGILLYFLGLGAPAFGILGMLVVLLGIRERQRQFVLCCLICLLPFLLITWVFATVAEMAFVSPETASLSIASPAKGILLILATAAGLLVFIVIFSRGMCIRSKIGDANKEASRVDDFA